MAAGQISLIPTAPQPPLEFALAAAPWLSSLFISGWRVYYITSSPSEYKHARILSLLCAISSLVAFLLSNKFQRVKVDTQSLFYVFQVAVLSYTLFGSF